jgi:hypothetical protein
MGVLTRVMVAQAIINSPVFYTPDDGRMWDTDSLCTYAAPQSDHDTSLTKTYPIYILSPYLSHCMPQIVTVVEVLDISCFVFCTQT